MKNETFKQKEERIKNLKKYANRRTNKNSSRKNFKVHAD